MTERETLELVAKGYHDLVALQKKQRDTTATLLRGCIARLQSPNSKVRREALKALHDLVNLMDPKGGPSSDTFD